MITNERQYKITRSRLREFTAALTRLSELPKKAEQPWLRAAQKESIEAQMDQLNLQIHAYEQLKAGKVKLPDPVSMVCETPIVLIQSRIAKGWDQKELADRLGMAKQQIQRYEQNYYAQATVSVLSRVAAILTGKPEPEMSSKSTLKKTSTRSAGRTAKKQSARVKPSVSLKVPAKKSNTKKNQKSR